MNKPSPLKQEIIRQGRIQADVALEAGERGVSIILKREYDIKIWRVTARLCSAKSGAIVKLIYVWYGNF